MRGWILALALVLSCAATDDATQTPAEGLPGGGKFDQAANDALLEGRYDAVAGFLRGVMTTEQVIEGDYRTVLDGVATQLNCDVSRERSFAILLTRAEFHPRMIFTHCSDDPTEASRFFLSTQSDDPKQDIDPRDIKMAAWDAENRRYNLYEMKPLADSDRGMKVTIEPSHCFGCHQGPVSLAATDLPWRPIMNELVSPWTLWNAAPDFESHKFDDTIDPAIRERDVFSAMTADGKLDAAANFEQIVRSGMDRVTNARLLDRHAEADLETALRLVRPLFCDETLNYVSENHDSGATHSAIIIDDAIRQLYLKVKPEDWPWDWLNDKSLRLTPPVGDEEELTVIPVRGEATLQVELGLVSRKVLDAIDVLRIRALDWKHPTLSEFRCGLWKSGAERLRKDTPDWVYEAQKNTDLLRPVLAELMTVGGTSLVPATGDDEVERVTAIADATTPDALDNLADRALTLDEWGEAMNAWFDEVEDKTDRVALNAEKTARACVAIEDYPAAPLIPDVVCGVTPADPQQPREQESREPEPAR